MRVELLIREVRINKNYTIDELSRLSGVSKGHLSKIERQEVEPSISVLVRIAMALKVDIKELYKVIN